MPHLSHPKYRPDIDGLRAIAVLAVVIFHAFPSYLKGGFIGVDIFFVISGYLISTIIFTGLDEGTFNLGIFYKKRVKRIFPSLALILIACAIFAWLALTADELNQLGKHILGGSTFSSNLILWSESGYFDWSSDLKPLLHLWSLGVEEQFYIAWPIILLLAYKKKFSLLAVIASLLATSFAVSIHLSGIDSIASFYSPVARGWELMLGSMLAWIKLYNPPIATIPSRKSIASLLSVIGLTLIMLGFFIVDKSTTGFPGPWAIVPVLGSGLIIYAGPKAWPNQLILSAKAAIWVGLISYPLYLWHWPILSFARIVNNGESPSKEARVLAIAISILLAWITSKTIEAPFRYGAKAEKAKVFILCFAIASMALVGTTISSQDFSTSHSFQSVTIKRRNFEHGVGYSMNWIQGKDNWLFLGNAYDNTIAKLKLAMRPTSDSISQEFRTFSDISSLAARSNTKTVLFLGPNKTSIYPEYLPGAISPSPIRYSSFYLERLKTIPNLTIYNPTDDLLKAKQKKQPLYWKTDTHWNDRGAYVAYSGFTRQLGLPFPKVKFMEGPPHKGDLLAISKLKKFPLDPEPGFEAHPLQPISLKRTKLAGQQDPAFGPPEFVSNPNAPANKRAWIVGDSFTTALKQYFNQTFSEVRYVSHWMNATDSLSKDLASANNKPDLIVVVRVERSF